MIYKRGSEKDIIRILVSLDQNYLFRFQVLLTSIAVNNPQEKMEIYLMHSDIPEEKLESVKLLSRFYNEFEPKVEDAFSKMQKNPPKETGELCPKCNSPLVIKRSKYGTFTACSNYPTCKYIKNEKAELKEIMNCPKCDGKIVEKKTRTGKIFYGCSNYPKCDFASWDEPIEERCPNCQNILVKKGKKIKCSVCNYEKEK